MRELWDRQFGLITITRAIILLSKKLLYFFFPLWRSLNFSSCATSGYITKKRSDKKLTTPGRLANGKRFASFPFIFYFLLYSSTRQRSHTLAYTATHTTLSHLLLLSWSHRKLKKEALASANWPPPTTELMSPYLIIDWLVDYPPSPPPILPGCAIDIPPVSAWRALQDSK